MGMFESIVCTGLVLLFAALIDLVLSARKIAARLSRLECLVESAIHYFTFDHRAYPYTHHMADGGFSVWAYRSGKWEMTDDFSREGFEPGPPPPHPGSFENEAVRKPSVRSPRVANSN
jgi:hypothetical protein